MNDSVILTKIEMICRYQTTAKVVAQRAKDQPLASVDTAAWWVEYVLRHDTTHLKSPAMKDSWWQKRLLDVWFIVYTILLITSFALYKTLQFVMFFIVRRLTNRNQIQAKKVL